MAMVEINWNPPRRQLRQFAGLLFLFALGLSGWLLYRGASMTTAGAVFSAIAGVATVGWFWTGLLRVVFVAWMLLAFPIGWVVSHVLLALIYYLIFTPIGIMMKLFGYDPMRRQLDREAKTYWRPRREEDDPQRYFKQY